MITTISNNLKSGSNSVINVSSDNFNGQRISVTTERFYPQS